MHDSPRVIAISAERASDVWSMVRQTWTVGDVAAPVPTGVPDAYRNQLLAAIAPTHVWADPSGSPAPIPGGVPGLAGDALVMCTSGTSGSPKAVVHTVEGLRWAAQTTAAALDALPLVGDVASVRWLACLPLHHIGGFSVLARAHFTGAEIVVHDGFEPAAVDQAADAGATHVSLVAAALPRIGIARWHRILLGGSAAPAVVPPNAVCTYGMTETGGGIVYDGRPLDGVEVKVVGGELCLRAPSVARSRRGPTPGGTPLADPDGWLWTGDMGSFEDGQVVVHGRSDSAIVTGGHKVWPEPIERILAAALGTDDLAVVGRADERWGERVVLVLGTSLADEPSLESVRSAVKAQLPAYCAPHAIERAEIPRTSLGKIRRAAL